MMKEPETPGQGYIPLPVPPELTGFIKTGVRFLVAGHKEPDGDCVGSQLALVSALRRLGKEASPCSAGPFKRTEVKPYESLFRALPEEPPRRDTRVLLVDCSSRRRTGDLAPFLEGLPLGIIDHHQTGDTPPSSAETPVYLDPGAPSVTFMIQRLMQALGMGLSPEEAELLFFGLCTDTGFFRHVDRSGAEVFAAAAEMIRAGADPKKTFQAINGGKSLDSRILMGLILSRAESHFGGKLILSSEKYEETRRFGLEGRDSDGLYMMFQSVGGVEATVLIRQETPETCTIGFRSRDQVDVAALAALFGGGGHKNAAGAQTPGTIKELRLKILEAFGKTAFFGKGNL
jgi:phosphoesterase RecJ-like protein